MIFFNFFDKIIVNLDKNNTKFWQTIFGGAVTRYFAIHEVNLGRHGGLSPRVLILSGRNLLWQWS